jgi:hypothetical protein
MGPSTSLVSWASASDRILEVVAGFVNCIRILFSYLVDKVYLFDVHKFVRSEVGDGENATQS